MSRKTALEVAIPTALVATPYPTHREIATGMGKYLTESYAVQLLGAGGVGASFTCPFEPAEVEIYKPAGPLAQKSMPTSDPSVRVAVNLITGAAAAAQETITAVSATDPSQGFTVSVPVGILGNGATAYVICRGYRPNAGN